MKILHVVTSIHDQFAGPSYSVPALCSALKSKGCDVKLLTLGPKVERNFPFEVEYFDRDRFMGSKIGKITGCSKTMSSRLKEIAKDFDLVHSHMLWKAPNIYPGRVCHQNNIPLVISPRGTLSEWAIKHNYWKKYISLKLGQRKTLNSCSMFHVTAESERDEVIRFGYENKDFAIVPNGIEIPSIEKEVYKKNRVVFVSRLHPKKGLDILVDVWLKICHLYPSWTLSIVGPTNNNFAKSLIVKVKESGCHTVKFEGEIYGEDKNKFLQESRLFVLPTHSENFGMVVAEALANNIPVICSKGAPWSGLVEEKCGWWIENSPKDLEEALIRALNLNPETLKSMGENGRKWMIREYSWESIAERMISSYSKLIERN